MAGKIKKRKLPKDLNDASALAVSHLNAVKKISEACQVLRSFSMTEVHSAIGLVDLPPDNAVLFLVAKYEIEDVLKVCSALLRLPKALPPSQKESMMQTATGRDDAGFIATFIRKYSPGLPSISNSLSHGDSPTALAPPTAICFECHKSLVFNHQCSVSVSKHVRLLLTFRVGGKGAAC